MHRRELLTGLAASALGAHLAQGAIVSSNVYLEMKTWRMHNTPEDQGARVADFLENGLAPALSRSGASLTGAFANLIGPDGPYYVTLTRYDSLSKMQDVLTALAQDLAYKTAVERLSAGPGLPFVRVESSLLRTFGSHGSPAAGTPAGSPRVFEMRTYESQSFTTLARKIGMFENGEIQIFERLGMNPVFFSEAIVGAKMPCVTYMLSFENLDARERLWRAFGSSPEWKRLSSQPELKDAQIVENISNVMLRPLPFSAIR
jgi:hypothetical protein